MAQPSRTSLRSCFVQRRHSALHGVLSSAQLRIRRQESTPDRIPVGCNDATDVIPKPGGRNGESVEARPCNRLLPPAVAKNNAILGQLDGRSRFQLSQSGKHQDPKTEPNSNQPRIHLSGNGDPESNEQNRGKSQNGLRQRRDLRTESRHDVPREYLRHGLRTLPLEASATTQTHGQGPRTRDDRVRARYPGHFSGTYMSPIRGQGSTA